MFGTGSELELNWNWNWGQLDRWNRTGTELETPSSEPVRNRFGTLGTLLGTGLTAPARLSCSRCARCPKLLSVLENQKRKIGHDKVVNLKRLNAY